MAKVFEALGVSSSIEALKKIGSLEELAAVMKKAGLLTSDLIFGIDYTASNKNQGRESFGGRSLHAILPDLSNPYEEVITILGKTLAPFSTSGHIPCYGFGDSRTTDESVFRLKTDGLCRSFDDVLEVYNKITPKIYLSGPTNFAPLIYQAIELCQEDGNYRILVIVADGQVTSERQTIQAIVDACDYPLSIIVVGVGDGPWKMMHKFDGLIPHRPWDNFHFVEYQRVVTEVEVGQRDLAFAIEALWEVPDQFQEIVKLGLVDFQRASAVVMEHEKIERERAQILAARKEREEEEHQFMQQKSSILQLMKVESSSEALQKISSLQEISEIMRQAGLKESNLIFGIDYTASNKYQGKNSFDGRSLHSIHDDILNPYQRVISILGNTLAPFATSGHLPAFGFGDAKTSDEGVFPLKKGGYCHDFDEVLQVYDQITPRVILSGPTNFAPLIYQAVEICKEERNYHILVIVADGQVTSEKDTREAILEACNYPLSIIVVGVGDGPWEMMEVFDDSLPQRAWDNFHFVEYENITKNRGEKADLAFAVECLLEIPDQFKEISRLGLVNSNQVDQDARSLECSASSNDAMEKISSLLLEGAPPPYQQNGIDEEPEFESPISPRKISMFQVLKVDSTKAALEQIQTLPEVSDIMRKAGLLSSNLIFGIDYTASNKDQGRNSFGGRSLHSISTEYSNPYQQVIRILGKTISPFCSNEQFAAFGFGDARTTDKSIFPLSKGGFCKSFDEVLTIYNRLTPTVVLSGPTNFAPLIDRAVEICRKDGDYHILVIAADGQVTETKDTIRAIVDACSVPLSIIVVGVGDGPWEMMHHFDDSIPARDWDNFHFVEYQKVARGQRSDLAFALEALLEIPDQFKQIRELGLLKNSRVIRAIEHTHEQEKAHPKPASSKQPTPPETAVPLPEGKPDLNGFQEEPPISARKVSVLQLMNAENKTEIVQKVKGLKDISDLMGRAGLKTSNLIFGIDYTASNKYQGEESFGGKSLHSINVEQLNPYQQVISIMGRTLEPFATSGFIPAFGFGDIYTSDQNVFRLKKDNKTENCRSFTEVLSWYNKVTPKVILSGPTNFAPLIYEAMETCKLVKDYHILVIVADGQVTSVKETRQAIVDACNLPLSIIVVGVGDGPWDMMRVFDASLPHRPWDNFHFVDFYAVTKNNPENADVAFALEALLEVPDQYKKIEMLGLLG